MPMSSPLRMHFLNGFYEAQPNGLTLPICSDNTGRLTRHVTYDPMKVTCKSCARLLLAMALYVVARASGAAVMEPLVKRWYARWGHRRR